MCHGRGRYIRWPRPGASMEAGAISRTPEPGSRQQKGRGQQSERARSTSISWAQRRFVLQSHWCRCCHWRFLRVVALVLMPLCTPPCLSCFRGAWCGASYLYLHCDSCLINGSSRICMAVLLAPGPGPGWSFFVVPAPRRQRGANSMSGQSDIAPDEVPTQYRRTPDTIPTRYRHNTDIVRQHYLKITRQKPGSS